VTRGTPPVARAVRMEPVRHRHNRFRRALRQGAAAGADRAAARPAPEGRRHRRFVLQLVGQVRGGRLRVLTGRNAGAET
jgi:hypothetical protein